MENPDTGLHVEFFTQSVENPRLSKEEGRPIFEDREMVKIRFPGDNKRELCAPAHEMHYHGFAQAQITYAERFPQHYEVFRKQGEARQFGTPLDRMNGLPQAKAKELQALGVHTVEQLSQMTDQAGRKMGMGWMALRDQASDYLKATKDQTDIEALKARIAELESATAQTDQFGGSPAGDQYADFTDDDLKNMIRDAGGAVPRGGAGRPKLIEALEALAADKEAA